MVHVAWNKNRDASVVLSKIKEFTISESLNSSHFVVRGWYNKDNFFNFGEFESKEEARKFLEKIHAQYQGG